MNFLLIPGAEEDERTFLPTILILNSLCEGSTNGLRTAFSIVVLYIRPFCILSSFCGGKLRCGYQLQQDDWNDHVRGVWQNELICVLSSSSDRIQTFLIQFAVPNMTTILIIGPSDWA